jgi:hypothetical protein
MLMELVGYYLRSIVILGKVFKLGQEIVFTTTDMPYGTDYYQGVLIECSNGFICAVDKWGNRHYRKIDHIDHVAIDDAEILSPPAPLGI